MSVKLESSNIKRKTALITGITGQDGSYLTEILINKGYTVHGIIRRSSSFNTGRIDHLYNNPDLLNKKLFLHHGDVTDTSNLNRLLEKTKPDEIYNLAAQSHVKVSFEIPEYTAEVDAIGTLRFLDAIRETGVKTKFYQASTSELYGKATEIPQSEKTPFYPRSPYGVAKIYGYWIVVNYREAYNLYACNGILFNHESPRRGETFVTKKITKAAVKIALGHQNMLSIGNLDAKRDWGYAPEFCEGMWLMLQQKEPEDFILATGEAHTVREFIEISFKTLGIGIKWKGKGINETGIIDDINKNVLDDLIQKVSTMGVNDFLINNYKKKPVKPLRNYNLKSSRIKKGQSIINISPVYFRPTEVDYLIGDYSKAKKFLGWQPNIKFKKLIQIMVENDLHHVLKKGY